MRSLMKWLLIISSLIIFSITALAENVDNRNICAYQISYSVNDSVNRLEAILKQKGITVFSQINFSADAKKAGIVMQDETLIIFGNPRAGTPLLKENPLIGLELPLKILVWQNYAGETELAYIKPSVIAARYGIQQTKAIAAKMDILLQQILADELKAKTKTSCT